MENKNENENYTDIDKKEVELQETQEELQYIATLAPLEQIHYAAKKFGIILRDPDPKCRKCNGKGYVGMRYNPVKKITQEPVACKCIQPKMDKRQQEDFDNRPFVPKNRKQRRMVEKLSKQKVTDLQLKTLEKLKEIEADRPITKESNQEAISNDK